MTKDLPKNADDSIATRASLLNRLKDHEDQASWQEFFEAYWSLIYGVARKAGLSDAEAQDVVQETVINVARKIGEFRYDPKVCSFKTWLLRLTRWRIIDKLRQRNNAGQPSGEPAAVGGCGEPRNDFSDDTARTATLERLPDPAGVELERIWDAEWEKTVFALACDRVRQRVAPEQWQMFDLYVVRQLPARRVAQ